MQMTMPKSRSLWPSMPRKVTWDRSGSFKLASPPASSARADAPPSNVSRAAGAPNLMNLQRKVQAVASHLSIHNPPFDHSFTGKWLPKIVVSGTLFRPSAFWRDRRAICSHSTRKKLPRAGPGLLQIGPAKRPDDEAHGLHKTSIYNILPMAGQTTAYEKGKRNPVSLGISARHVLANRW